MKNLRSQPHRAPQMRAWMVRKQGAALILAMMVILVLSALGLVAMRSVSESVWLSGIYRVRTQANLVSDSVTQFGSYRAGTHAPGYVRMLQDRTRLDLAAGGDYQQLRRGAYQIFTADGAPIVIGGETIETVGLGSIFTADQQLLFDQATGGKEVLFGDRDIPFHFIIRDPLDGPPAPGYSNHYCFKKVTVASDARVGTVDATTWHARNSASMGRHLVETMIGPVDCGSR